MKALNTTEVRTLSGAELGTVASGYRGYYDPWSCALDTGIGAGAGALVGGLWGGVPAIWGAVAGGVFVYSTDPVCWDY